PRVKETKDEAWAEAHGTNQVDIANTSYEDLPTDWQAENKAAAEVVVELIDRANGQIDLNDESVRTSVGDTVHTAWLERNDWAKGGELDKPFGELPSDEQAKDIEQVEIGLGLFQSQTARREFLDRAHGREYGMPEVATLRRLGEITKSVVRTGEHSQAKAEVGEKSLEASRSVQEFIENPTVWEALSKAEKDVNATFKHEELRIEVAYHKGGSPGRNETYPGSGSWSLIIHEEGKRARRVMFSPGFTRYVENAPQGENTAPELAISGLVFEHAGRLANPNTRGIHEYTPVEQRQLYSTIEGAFDTLREGLESSETKLAELEGTFADYVHEQDYHDDTEVIRFST
ncbi:hypothetical protein BVY00_02625, partial [bacterium G20]